MREWKRVTCIFTGTTQNGVTIQSRFSKGKHLQNKTSPSPTNRIVCSHDHIMWEPAFIKLNTIHPCAGAHTCRRLGDRSIHNTYLWKHTYMEECTFKTVGAVVVCFQLRTAVTWRAGQLWLYADICYTYIVQNVLSRLQNTSTFEGRTDSAEVRVHCLLVCTCCPHCATQQCYWADKDLLGSTWLKSTVHVQLTVLKLLFHCEWAVQVLILSTPCLLCTSILLHTTHGQEITTWQCHVSCQTIQTSTECTVSECCTCVVHSPEIADVYIVCPERKRKCHTHHVHYQHLPSRKGCYIIRKYAGWGRGMWESAHFVCIGWS